MTDQPCTPLTKIQPFAISSSKEIEGDNNAAKTLSKLENGVRTVVDTGTHYEMDQKALALIQEWCEKEDFKWRDDDADDARVWESLREIVALATSRAHTGLFEVSNVYGPRMRFDRWQGCTDKNGDDYEYAYTGTMIEARPRVTAKHGVNARPTTTNIKEMADWVRKVVEIRQALGPDRKFILD